MYNDRLTGGRCSEVAYAVYNDRLTNGCCSEVAYATQWSKMCSNVHLRKNNKLSKF